MKRVLVSLLAVTLYFAPLPSTAVEVKTLDKVLRSVVRLQVETGQTICTGFVVMPEHVMTAAHCIDPEYPLIVDGKPASVVKLNEEKDLALLKVENLNRPYLTFRKKPMAHQDEIASIGYPYGGESLFVYTQRVAAFSFKGWALVVYGTYSPGMSGGPNIDDKGQVIGITQAGNETIGLAQDAKTMVEFLGS